MIRYWRNPEDMAPGVNLPIDEVYPPPQMFPAPVQAVTAFAAILLVTSCGVRNDDVPAGSLFGRTDEDAYRPRTPLAAPQPQLRLVDEDFVAPAATAVLDEDYWLQPPLQLQPQPKQPPWELDEPPAGSLYGVPEEDQYAPLAPLNWTFVRVFADTDEVPAPVVTFQPDEDFWVSPPPASALQLRASWTDEDFVAPVVATIVDEDFWSPPRPAPAPAPQAFLPDPGDVLGFLTIEEQDPPVLARPGTAQALRRVWDDEVWVAPAPTVSDEDYWFRAVQVSIPVFRQTWVDDDFRFTTFAPIQDEDFWHNPVSPVVAANYQRLPYLPDPEEIPAGNLVQPTVPKLVLVALGPQNAGTNILGSSIIGPSQPGVGTGTTIIGPTGVGVGTGSSTIIGPTKGS